MATQLRWTYQDIVEHILDVFDSERSGRPLRIARRAAMEGLRTLQTAHQWAMYRGRRIVTTTAPYETGTIAYDHTGGAAERLVTLTTGTWPSDALYSRIKIDGSIYPVERVLSTTTLTLREDDNPGADVAAGTTYEMFRDAYPLPVGFYRIGEAWDLTNDRLFDVVFRDQATRETVPNFDDSGEPEQAYIINDEAYPNRLSLVFMPPPDAAYKYEYDYQREPRPLVTEKYSTGTVSVSAGTAACTITTGTFTAKHVGCVIRFGTAAAAPDSIIGGLTDSDNPFAYERTIVAVATNGASCTLDSVIASAQTSVLFTVSDPLDLEYGVMLTAYQRLCEAAYAQLARRDRSELHDFQQAALLALLEAKANDTRIDQIPTEEDRYLVGEVDVLNDD